MKLISVIIPTYKRLKLLKRAIKSVQEQTYKNIEIIVIDDGSKDDTFEWLKSQKGIIAFKSFKNIGKSDLLNCAIRKAKGEYISFLDDDDIYLPNKLTSQMKAIGDAELLYSDFIINKGGKKENYKAPNINQLAVKNVDFRKVDNVHKIYSKKDKYIPFCSILCKKSIFKKVEFDKNLKSRLDGDFWINCLVKGIKLKYHPETSYIYNITPGSLVFDEIKKFNSFKRISRKIQKRLYNEKSRELTIGNMASFPAREESLRNVLRRIYKQFDKFNIYLNNYEKVPVWLQDDVKIQVFRSQDNEGDLKAKGKYFNVANEEGYIFTLDDDINYAHSYVNYLVHGIEKYNRGSVVGIHGSSYDKKPIESYFNNMNMTHYKWALVKDRQVDMIGTGTAAWHSSLLKTKLADFPNGFMVDIWFNILCQNNNIPRFILERAEKYCFTTDKSEVPECIYRTYKDNHEYQTRVINDLLFNKNSVYPDLAVVIHTCDNYKWIWNDWYKFFKLHWNFDLPIKVYFMNENEDVDFDNVIQIKTGNGEWTQRLRKGLNTIVEENILYLQEDYWLTKELDVLKYYDMFKFYQMDALRITPSKYLKASKAKGILHRIDKDSPYLMSHRPSIWKKKFFLDNIKGNESPWDNEINQTEKLKGKDIRLYWIKERWFEEVVRKGKLQANGKEMLK